MYVFDRRWILKPISHCKPLSQIPMMLATRALILEEGLQRWSTGLSQWTVSAGWLPTPLSALPPHAFLPILQAWLQLPVDSVSPHEPCSKLASGFKNRVSRCCLSQESWLMHTFLCSLCFVFRASSPRIFQTMGIGAILYKGARNHLDACQEEALTDAWGKVHNSDILSEAQIWKPSPLFHTSGPPRMLFPQLSI